MTTQEIQLLKGASQQIKNLRRDNQLMSARLEMFDSMMLLFTSSPPGRNGMMSPDITYDIDKLVTEQESINQLKKAEA
jgi:hypothetical protein